MALYYIFYFLQDAANELISMLLTLPQTEEDEDDMDAEELCSIGARELQTKSVNVEVCFIFNIQYLVVENLYAICQV